MRPAWSMSASRLNLSMNDWSRTSWRSVLSELRDAVSLSLSLPSASIGSGDRSCSGVRESGRGRLRLVGDAVGNAVGDAVGEAVGDAVGDAAGRECGALGEGECNGDSVPCSDQAWDGFQLEPLLLLSTSSSSRLRSRSIALSSLSNSPAVPAWMGVVACNADQGNECGMLGCVGGEGVGVGETRDGVSSARRERLSRPAVKADEDCKLESGDDPDESAEDMMRASKRERVVDRDECADDMLRVRMVDATEGAGESEDEAVIERRPVEVLWIEVSGEEDGTRMRIRDTMDGAGVNEEEAMRDGVRLTAVQPKRRRCLTSPAWLSTTRPQGQTIRVVSATSPNVNRLCRCLFLI